MSAKKPPHDATDTAVDNRLFRAEPIAFLVVLIAIFYAVYLTLRPVLMVILIAAAIVSVTFPIYRKIVTRLGSRHRVGAVVAVLSLLGAAVLPLVGGAILLFQQLAIEVQVVMTEIKKDGGVSAVNNVLAHLGPLGPPLESVVTRVQPMIVDEIPSLAGRIGQLVGQFGQALAHLGLSLFILSVALYYFFLNGAAWRDRLVDLLPLRPDDTRLFLVRFRQVSSAVIVGNIGTAFAQGLVGTIGYMLFGVPATMLWGFMTILAAFIPVVGTLLVWLPIALYVMATQGWTRGVLFTLYNILLVGGLDNVVRPMLTRRGLHIHPLLIFLSIFGGFAAFGFAGLFIGPLYIALGITMVEIYEKRRSRQNIPA